MSLESEDQIDKLSNHFKKVLKYSMNFANLKTDDIDEKQKLTEYYATKSLIHQINSIMESVNWKINREEKIKINKANIKEDIVDIYRISLVLSIIWEMDHNDLDEEFNKKDMVLWQKFKNQNVIKNLKNSKVVILDIDEVLCDFLQTMIRFVRDTFGIDLFESEITNYNFKQILEKKGVPIPTYIKEKDKFYNNGGFLECGVKPSAVKLTKVLKEEGYKIILLSSRPSKKYKRIVSDTIQWCRNNNIIYDAILWDKEKDIHIVKKPEIYNNTSFMIEDNPMYAYDIAQLGLKVYVPHRPYNKNMPKHDNITMINSLDKVISEIKEKKLNEIY